MKIIEIILRHSRDIISILAACGVVIEITPVKFNPLSFLSKKIGLAINSDINIKVEQLTSQLNILDCYVKENHKKDLRIQISNFASDLRHGDIKSESQFIAIIELCDEYLENKWNSKVKLDAQFIKEEYIKLGHEVQIGKFNLKGRR